eukprot:scaffold28036_cov28-Phaeocystis_antarctica.AAC.1
MPILGLYLLWRYPHATLEVHRCRLGRAWREERGAQPPELRLLSFWARVRVGVGVGVRVWVRVRVRVQ